MFTSENTIVNLIESIVKLVHCWTCVFLTASPGSVASFGHPGEQQSAPGRGRMGSISAGVYIICALLFTSEPS